MIKHRFVSTVPDGPEANKVRPSNWNDSHVIEDRSIFSEHLDLGTEFGQINTDVIPEGVINKYTKAVTSLSVMYLENGDTTPLVIGTPVYFSGNTMVRKGQANISGTKDIVGLVRDSSIAVSGNGFIQTSDILVATISAWAIITGQAGGLIPGVLYYLDPYFPGRLTSAVPAVSGQYAVEIGRAFSSTEIHIDIKLPVLI